MRGPIKLHSDTFETLQEENAGVCIACLNVQYGVEPDAEKYQCEACDREAVYSIELLLILNLILIVPAETPETRTYSFSA